MWIELGVRKRALCNVYWQRRDGECSRGGGL